MQHPLVLVDQARLEAFSFLGRSRRPFLSNAQTWSDADGVAWTGIRVGTTGIGFTWLGPNWMFDVQGRQEGEAEYLERLSDMRQAAPARNRREFAAVARQLRLGCHAERLLSAIHAAVLDKRRSLLHLPDRWLAEAVWGRRAALVRHWRQDLMAILRGLARLHVAPWPDIETMPGFGSATALITHVGDLRGEGDIDRCPADCLLSRDNQHHHIQVDIGPGFLGVLQQFADPTAENGLRTYSFPICGGPVEPSLRKAGRTGRLRSVFLPAIIGDPAACNSFTPSQHQLLQAIMRETTRPARRGQSAVNKAQFGTGNRIKAFLGRHMIPCSMLDPEGSYVAFAGNRKRSGMGYCLTTPGGWLAKAGYDVSAVAEFLYDFAALAKPLGLVIVGIDHSDRVVDLDKLRVLAAAPAGRSTLAQLHVRVYTAADYLQRWSNHFQPGGSVEDPLARAESALPAATVLAAMRDKGISGRTLAAGVGTDPSFVAKVLRGEKPWPKELLEEAQAYLAQAGDHKLPLLRRPGGDDESVKSTALACLSWGWSVVPQQPRAKKPCVRWKPFQDRLPTPAIIENWFLRWPDAGLALILGPISDVLVIDVDGPEARAVLLERLGREPVAPMAVSGSHKPDRFHLFFRHPDLVTRAKQTPWHEHLEFRGAGGIVVIPPSLHPSGNRYAWVAGRGPTDLALPAVPRAVYEALRPVERVKPSGRPAGRPGPLPTGLDASPRPREFLAGNWSDGPRWNDRLFNGACDLKGRGMSIEKAEPLLLAGARPWSAGEEELARRTIRSAFSQSREPARK